MDRIGLGVEFERLFSNNKKVLDAYKSGLNSERVGKERVTVASDECKYKDCDGSGMIYYKNYGGQDIVKMCQCKIDDNAMKCLESLMIPSAFRGLTFDDFDINAYPDSMKSVARLAVIEAREYIKEYDDMDGMGLYFVSETTGSGKSMLACIVVQELIKKNNIFDNVMYINLADWAGVIDKARNFKSEFSVSDVVDEVSSQELILFDDIGCSYEIRGKVAEALYSVLNRRISNKKTTLFTSNDNLDSLGYDVRTISRINGMSKNIVLPEFEVRGEVKSNFVSAFVDRIRRGLVKSKNE